MIRVRVHRSPGVYTIADGSTLAAAVRGAAGALGLVPGKTRAPAPTTLDVGQSCTWPWSRQGEAVDLSVERLPPKRSSGPSGRSKTRAERQADGWTTIEIMLDKGDKERLDELVKRHGSKAAALRAAIRREYEAGRPLE